MRIIYGLFAIVRAAPRREADIQTDNFRQGETTLFSCKPEILAKLPPETLRLMGYYAGKTGGGRFLGRNPVETWEPLKGYKLVETA